MTGSSTVLSRMAGGGGPAPARMTADRALRLALMRVGEARDGLQLSVTDVSEARGALAGLLDALEERALILRLAAPEARDGLAVLCPELTAAIVEAETTGAVGAARDAPREPTGTDAALAAGPVAAVLDEFAGLAAGLDLRVEIGGRVVAGRMAGPRAVAARLDDLRYRRWEARLALGPGGRTGRLMLALPEGGARPPAAEADGDGAFRERLVERVMDTDACLDAVLARLHLPLEDLAGLAAGQVLPLGGVTIDDVTLVAADGAEAARARLGRAGAFRAVRLARPAAPGAGDDARALPEPAPADPAAQEAPATAGPEASPPLAAGLPAAEADPDAPS